MEALPWKTQQQGIPRRVAVENNTNESLNETKSLCPGCLIMKGGADVVNTSTVNTFVIGGSQICRTSRVCDNLKVGYRIVSPMATQLVDTSDVVKFIFCSVIPYEYYINYIKNKTIKNVSKSYCDIIVILVEVDCTCPEKKVFFHRQLITSLYVSQLLTGYTIADNEILEIISIYYHRPLILGMVDEHRIVLSRELQDNPLLADLWEAVQSNDSFKERLIQRTTTLQISVLESVGVQPNRRIVVANTHLYFHPDADHIRMLQAGICLRILRQIMMLHEAKDPSKDVSLLFCGDFNSTPEFGVYRLMTSQFIDTDDMDWN
ncbi:unnamed protein product, partial [Meganyctiphanes norvegica]